MTRNTAKHSGVSGSSTDISIWQERAPLYYLSGALLLLQPAQCLYEKNTALDCKNSEIQTSRIQTFRPRTKSFRLLEYISLGFKDSELQTSRTQKFQAKNEELQASRIQIFRLQVLRALDFKNTKFQAKNEGFRLLEYISLSFKDSELQT